MRIERYWCTCGLMSVCTAAFVLLCGCAGAAGEQPQTPPEPAEVYNDGMYAVEAGVPAVTVTDDGAVRTDIPLCIRNGSAQSMAVSEVLGIRVSAGKEECELTAVPEGLEAIDGLIKAGENREGYISVLTPVEQNSFTIEMAVDYLDDRWIEFVVSR